MFNHSGKVDSAPDLSRVRVAWISTDDSHRPEREFRGNRCKTQPHATAQIRPDIVNDISVITSAPRFSPYRPLRGSIAPSPRRQFAVSTMGNVANTPILRHAQTADAAISLRPSSGRFRPNSWPGWPPRRPSGRGAISQFDRSRRKYRPGCGK
jgi:hypothetical protein